MLCFLQHARIACIQTVLHELAAPGFKVQSARKFCAETLTHHLLILVLFFKGDTCDKHLPKFVFGIQWPSVSFCSASAKNFHFGASLIITFLRCSLLPTECFLTESKTNLAVYSFATIF